MADTKIYTAQEMTECVNIDFDIKKYQARVADLLSKKAAQQGILNSVDQVELSLKRSLLQNLENRFVMINCRDKIEYQRLLDAADISTDFAKKQEDDLLKKNLQEQNIYIGIGAIVLIAGLIILTQE